MLQIPLSLDLDDASYPLVGDKAGSRPGTECLHASDYAANRALKWRTVLQTSVGELDINIINFGLLKTRWQGCRCFDIIKWPGGFVCTCLCLRSYITQL